MSDGTYRQELDAWARAREATARIVGTRGRPPQQDEPDWEDRDGGGVAPSGQGSATRGLPGIDAAASASVACPAAYRVVAELEGRA